jgi:hypothetical protein
MKSVAHLPWRALTYKAFNTFIDDGEFFFLKEKRTKKKAQGIEIPFTVA